MTKYNWDRAPASVKWIAIDHDGGVWGYDREPEILPDSGEWARGKSPTLIECYALGTADTIINCYDWTESLEQRPPEPDRYEVRPDRHTSQGRIYDTVDCKWLPFHLVAKIMNEYDREANS
jgi:hypothetical protein